MCIAKLNLKFQNKTRQKHTYRNQNNQNLMKNDNIQYTKIQKVKHCGNQTWGDYSTNVIEYDYFAYARLRL